MAHIMQPSEQRQTDPRAKAFEGYEGLARLEGYGFLLPVDKVLGGIVQVTGQHLTDDAGNLFLECKEVKYVSFQPSDYTIKEDGIQWLAARSLIIDLEAEKPSDRILESQREREEEGLKALLELLDEKLLNCPVTVCLENFPGNPSYGVVVIRSRGANYVPTVSYDRFESANWVGDYAVLGERKDWKMDCFWQFDQVAICSIATEVADFACQQADEVDRGLAEIAALNVR